MAARLNRQAIYDVWSCNTPEKRRSAVVNFILERFDSNNLSKAIKVNIRVSARSFCQKIENKWKKANRHKHIFLSKNSDWLRGDFRLSLLASKALENVNVSKAKRGRPELRFEECGPRAQKNKVRNLVHCTSEKQLLTATEMKLRKEGKRELAIGVREIASSSTEGTSLKKARKAQNQKSDTLTPDQALAMMIDAQLSTYQYNIIRNQIKPFNKNLYPPYYKVKLAKQLCYPSDIIISEVSAEIKLQSLINHTILRLYEAQKDVFEAFPFSPENKNPVLVVKWGCDGADQHKYRQKFIEEGASDGSMFSLSMVPLQLYFDNRTSKSVLWKNPAPSSTRYCRPIKFFFGKETAEVTRSEVRKIEEQIEKLLPTEVNVNNLVINITTKMVLSMIDGKVCNSLSSNTSTSTCYLCKAKPRDMNSPNSISGKSVDKNFLSFGLSPLHSWIRFFECLIHISYKLDLKTWQARGEENKLLVEERKRHIQERFRMELGLLIDMPKQQAGNTNDGNTARKFFRNADISAQITQINLELIVKFRVILETINCGYEIDLLKFDKFLTETRALYLKEYSWYPMPVSVHKVLWHGTDIVSSFMLPIGQFSEEAQEARNKDNRKYRELFTRKSSRVHTNEDLIHRLLITSDPFIASLRSSPKTNRQELLPEVLALLKSVDICTQSDYDSSGISDND